MEQQEKIASLEAQIKRLEKMASLGTLMAGIIHEIQNPLNFVINFSKMSEKLVSDIEEIISDNEQAINEDDREDLEDMLADLKENMKKIDEHGDRAISIVRNILLYSRGKQDAYIPTDIPKVVKEYVWLAYHAMRANFKGFNVAINENYQEDMPMVSVVTQDLCRAVLNIMNNACYAVWQKQKEITDGSYHPQIDVATAIEDQQLVISIADNGVGMSEEVKQRIYEDFFTTKPEGEGTGLGMALTKDIIVNKHHGTIEFDSKAGEGTSFRLCIPINK